MPGADLLYGPMLAGVLVNTFLYGVLMTQMFTYYMRYPDDFKWIRYFVLYLFCVATAELIVVAGIVYQPLISQYGSVESFIFFPKLLVGDSILIILVSTPIQLFTAWRMRILTKSYILPLLTSVLSLGTLSAGILFTSSVARSSGRFTAFRTFEAQLVAWLVSTAVCDLVLAGGMAHALLTRRTGGFNPDVDSRLEKIVRLSVQSGSLTAVAAILDVVLALGVQGASINFIVDFPLASIYICSMLAMLNARVPKRPADTEKGLSSQTMVGYAYPTPVLLYQKPTLSTQTNGTATVVAKPSPGPEFYTYAYDGHTSRAAPEPEPEPEHDVDGEADGALDLDLPGIRRSFDTSTDAATYAGSLRTRDSRTATATFLSPGAPPMPSVASAPQQKRKLGPPRRSSTIHTVATRAGTGVRAGCRRASTANRCSPSTRRGWRSFRLCLRRRLWCPRPCACNSRGDPRGHRQHDGRRQRQRSRTSACARAIPCKGQPDRSVARDRTISAFTSVRFRSSARHLQTRASGWATLFPALLCRSFARCHMFHRPSDTRLSSELSGDELRTFFAILCSVV